MNQVVFGGRMNIPKGTTFFKTGESVEHVYLVVNGQVRAKSEYMKMTLDNGALLGILDIYSEEYLFDYEAVTDLIVLCFDIAHADGILKLLKLGKNYQEIPCLHSSMKFIRYLKKAFYRMRQKWMILMSLIKKKILQRWIWKSAPI